MTRTFTWSRVNKLGRYSVLQKAHKDWGYKFFNDFFEEFIRTFVRENSIFTQYTGGDFAFGHEEKQVHSVLFPSFYKKSHVCFREMPLQRGFNYEKRGGLLDYWVLAQKKSFLIEVKHAIWSPFDKRKKNEQVANVRKKWLDMIKQLKDIKWHITNRYFGKEDYIYKTGLIVIPVKMSVIESLDVINSKKKILELKESLIEFLNVSPDWISVVQIDNCQAPFTKKQEEFCFPFIFVLIHKETHF